MASDDEAARFVPRNERLNRALSDPDRRARVNGIVEEMHLLDSRYHEAVQVLDGAVAATIGTEAATEVVLEALRCHLTAAGVRAIGITLTFSHHEVTVPLARTSSNAATAREELLQERPSPPRRILAPAARQAAARMVLAADKANGKTPDPRIEAIAEGREPQASSSGE